MAGQLSLESSKMMLSLNGDLVSYNCHLVESTCRREFLLQVLHKSPESKLLSSVDLARIFGKIFS